MPFTYHNFQVTFHAYSKIPSEINSHGKYSQPIQFARFNFINKLYLPLVLNEIY